jgi:hypothetical protein
MAVTGRTSCVSTRRTSSRVRRPTADPRTARRPPSVRATAAPAAGAPKPSTAWRPGATTGRSGPTRYPRSRRPGSSLGAPGTARPSPRPSASASARSSPGAGPNRASETRFAVVACLLSCSGPSYYGLRLASLGASTQLPPPPPLPARVSGFSRGSLGTGH